MTKERPIIFSSPMVRAILDGRKTQTRRIMKPQPSYDFGWYPGCGDDGKSLHYANERHFKKGVVIDFPKFGKPGDKLWIRESWRIGAWREDGRMAIDYKSSPETNITPWVEIPQHIDPNGDIFQYYWKSICDELKSKGIERDDDGEYHWEPGKAPLKWRPSIHMPRWASRITLEITGVRVERLNDISEEDALLAEGFKGITKDGGITIKYGIPDIDGFPGTDDFGWPWHDWEVNPVLAYKKLWEQINGKGSWDRNPWVWVIEFERVNQ